MPYKPHKLVRDKIAKKQEKQQFWRVFLFESVLFLTTSLLAVFNASKLQELFGAQKIYNSGPSFLGFLLSFLIVTVIVVLIVYSKRINKLKGAIYHAIFILAVFSGGMAVLNCWAPTLLGIILMGLFIFLWLEKPVVWIHNLIMVLCFAGVASVLGLSFDSMLVVLLLIIFSFYDFIAVYKTKHMIKLATEMLQKRVVLGFVIPKQTKFFKDEIKEIKPGGNFMILGGGDVVFPALLAVSVVPLGILKAVVVVVFSLFGSWLSYWLFATQKEKEPMPALPPIALFSIIGYLITLLLP